MLTIEDVFAEIKKRFNAKKVCLLPASTIHASGGECATFLQKDPSTQIKSGVSSSLPAPDMENPNLRSGAQGEKSQGMATLDLQEERLEGPTDSGMPSRTFNSKIDCIEAFGQSRNPCKLPQSFQSSSKW